MLRKSLSATVLAGAVMIFVSAAAMAQPNGQDVVMAGCAKCHNTKRVCAALGVKDKAAWQATVARMVKNGAQLSDANQAAAADYLAGLAPGSKPVCGQ